MLRITSNGDAEKVTLKIEGRLRAPWVQELHQAWEQVTQRAAQVELDLSGVGFIDQAGTHLIRTLLGRGASLGACSSFVTELLRPLPTTKAPEPADPEAALLADLRAGDERACEQLVRMYYPRMMAVARKLLRQDADRDDAVQEALISALNGIERFDGKSQLWTWLHRITINSCLMKLRSSRRHEAASLDEFLPRFDAAGRHAEVIRNWRSDPIDSLAIEEARQQVRRCIDELPEPYRTVVILRDIDGFSTAETANLTGTTEANVKTRLHRARLALRTMLSPMYECAA